MTEEFEPTQAQQLVADIQSVIAKLKDAQRSCSRSEAEAKLASNDAHGLDDFLALQAETLRVGDATAWTENMDRLVRAYYLLLKHQATSPHIDALLKDFSSDLGQQLTLVSRYASATRWFLAWPGTKRSVISARSNLEGRWKEHFLPHAVALLEEIERSENAPAVEMRDDFIQQRRAYNELIFLCSPKIWSNQARQLVAKVQDGIESLKNGVKACDASEASAAATASAVYNAEEFKRLQAESLRPEEDDAWTGDMDRLVHAFFVSRKCQGIKFRLAALLQQVDWDVGASLKLVAQYASGRKWPLAWLGTKKKVISAYWDLWAGWKEHFLPQADALLEEIARSKNVPAIEMRDDFIQQRRTYNELIFLCSPKIWSNQARQLVAKVQSGIESLKNGIKACEGSVARAEATASAVYNAEGFQRLQAESLRPEEDNAWTGEMDQLVHAFFVSRKCQEMKPRLTEVLQQIDRDVGASLEFVAQYASDLKWPHVWLDFKKKAISDYWDLEAGWGEHCQALVDGISGELGWAANPNVAEARSDFILHRQEYTEDMLRSSAVVWEGQTKQLLANFHSTMEKLNDIRQKNEAVRMLARHTALSVYDANGFQMLQEEALQSGDIDAWNRDMDRLVQAFFLVRRHQDLEPKIIELFRRSLPPISHGVALVEPHAISGNWSCVGAARKDEIIAVYQELFRKWTQDFQPQANDILREMEHAEKADALEIRNDFSKNQAGYKTAMRDLAGSRWSSLKPAPSVMAIFELWNRQIWWVRDAQKSVDVRQNAVIESARAMAAHEAFEQLKGISIEELKRVGSGFKVKILREHGVETIADAYAGSETRLASMRGISPSAARLIKGAAAQIAENVSKGVRIRLSVDEANPDSVRLVEAIYDYRRYENRLRRLSELLDTIRRKYEASIYALEPAGDGTEWIFFPREERAVFADAFSRLKAYLSDPACAEFEPLVAQSATWTDVTREQAWQDFDQNVVAYSVALSRLVPELTGNEEGDFGLPEDLARAIQDQDFFPDGLKCTLYPYQELGVKYILHQEKVLLGDEMGLGKTIQAIASMVSLRNTGATHFMVICPASVLPNWVREIEKHSKLRVEPIYGRNWRAQLDSWTRQGGVAVTTYETTDNIRLGADFRFSMLVVDEAHYIKNAKTRRARNATRIMQAVERILFMTGTALENRVDEMLALIRLLRPDVAQKAEGVAHLVSAEQFRKEVISVYFRRKREQVANDLPELTEIQDWSRLADEERSVYERDVLAKEYMRLRQVSWSVPDMSMSVKAQRLREIVQEAADNGRKVLVFSYFLETIRKVRKILGDICMRPINGSTPVEERQEILDIFEQADGGTVLPAQILAGGTGLNIQAASVVILCEPQLKPSTENQAISRAYRTGQKHNVTVYRLLCEDTIDERITRMLAEKQEIFNAFADESEAARKAEAEIDPASFGELIQEEINRINVRNSGIQTEAS